MWRSFSQFVSICVLATLTGGSVAAAQGMRCENLWGLTRLESEDVEFNMGRYMTMMDLSEINHRDKTLDAVKKRFREMPSSLRNDLLGLVRDEYAQVKAFKYFNEEHPIKSWKRQMDTIITEAADAYTLIRDEFEKNPQIESALDAYFKRVQQLTAMEKPMKAEAVLMTALRIQEIAFGPNDPADLGPVVLYGSFTNGRSFEKTSDLDFAVTGTVMEQRLSQKDVADFLPDFPFSEAQAHTVSQKEIHELGYLNPVVIFVHKDYIEVRVYRSEMFREHLRGEARFSSYYF